jgi:transglutaminase-like putative cysteine protease
MNPRAISLFALAPLATLLLSCGGGTSWLNDEDLRKSIHDTEAESRRHADTGALVLLDEGSMEINSGGEIGVSIFERHSIVRIVNARGHKFANVIIPYTSWSVIDQIQARTATRDGRIVPLHDTDIFDVSLYPNFVFFSDQRAKIFTMPAIDDGAVVEYRYRLTLRGRTYWPSWVFQSDVPVLLSRFTLVKPGDWDVVYRSYGIPLTPAITNAPPPFRSKHVWEAHDLPPLHEEYGMPPEHEVVTRLAIAPVGFKTWEDVAHWFHEVVGQRNRGGHAIEAVAESLTRGSHSDRETLQRLYEWVRERIRYIAVEIGTGGYEPHSADEVFEKRYGDCKDLVMLLSALAHAVNIDVRPVLISTWHNGRPDTSLPSAVQFNHLIGFAPDVKPGGIWLDATDKAGIFDRLPWYDQGTPVIVAGPGDKGHRDFTPVEPAGANSNALAWDAELNADGSATVTGKTVLAGAFALELRNELRMADSSAVRQWLATTLAHRCPGATLISYALPPDYPIHDSLTISYRFRAPSFAARRDSHLVVRPWAFDPSVMADYFRDSARTWPVRFRHPSQSELRLTIWAPLGWRIASHFSSDTAGTAFGHCEWRVSTQPESAQLSMMVRTRGEDLQPAQYARFKDFLDGLRMKEVFEMELSRRQSGE